MTNEKNIKIMIKIDDYIVTVKDINDKTHYIEFYKAGGKITNKQKDLNIFLTLLKKLQNIYLPGILKEFKNIL